MHLGNLAGSGHRNRTAGNLKFLIVLAEKRVQNEAPIVMEIETFWRLRASAQIETVTRENGAHRRHARAPVPGDGLVGFVTVGRGVSVHRADCTNITALGENPERMIEVIWDPSTAGSFTVWIQVEALDRPKLLRDVTAIIGDQGANIVASSSSSSPDRIAILRYEVELGDTEQLERLLADLRGAAGVMDAFRLITT